MLHMVDKSGAVCMYFFVSQIRETLGLSTYKYSLSALYHDNWLSGRLLEDSQLLSRVIVIKNIRNVIDSD